MRSLIFLSLLAAGRDDVPAPIAAWKAAEGAVNEVAFSPSGKVLATADESGEIRLWDAATRAPLRTLGSHRGRVGDDVIGGVEAIAFSGDGKLLASIGGDGKLKLWDPATGAPRGVLGEVRHARTLAFAPDGAWLATVAEFDSRTAVCLFDARSPRKPRLLAAEGLDGMAVAISPDGSRIAASANRGRILVWAWNSGALAGRFETGTPLVLALAFTPDGKALAACGSGPVKLFDPAAGREVAAFEGLRSSLDMKLSPDGRRIAASSRDGEVAAWDVATRKPLATFGGHADMVRTLAFSPDGRTIASADKGGAVKLWNAPGVVSSPPVSAGPAVPRAIALRFDGPIRPGEPGHHPGRTTVRLRFGPGDWRKTSIGSSLAWGDGNKGRDRWGEGSGEPTFASEVARDAGGDYFLFSINGANWESRGVAALIRMTLPDGKPAVASASFPCR